MPHLGHQSTATWSVPIHSTDPIPSRSTKTYHWLNLNGVNLPDQVSQLNSKDNGSAVRNLSTKVLVSLFDYLIHWLWKFGYWHRRPVILLSLNFLNDGRAKCRVTIGSIRCTIAFEQKWQKGELLVSLTGTRPEKVAKSAALFLKYSSWTCWRFFFDNLTPDLLFVRGKEAKNPKQKQKNKINGEKRGKEIEYPVPVFLTRWHKEAVKNLTTEFECVAVWIPFWVDTC